MTIDKQHEYSSSNEKANLKPTKESNNADQDSSISKENLPSFSKILITDDGKDESNKVLNYAVSLSRYTGAELLILRILGDIGKLGGVSVQGSNEDNIGNKDGKQQVKGEVIDEMEKKIKRCKEAGCENKISYKLRVGDAKDEILNEVKEGNYDLLILRSSHMVSWIGSFFSNARKILGNINIPVLIVN